MKIRLNGICGMLLLLLSGQLGLKYRNKQRVPYCICPPDDGFEAGHVSQAVPLSACRPSESPAELACVHCLTTSRSA